MSDGSTGASSQLHPGSEYDDRGPAFRSYAIVLTALTVVAICLRFWSRALLKPQHERHRFWWDDWMALICAPVVLAQLILSLVLVNLGVGRHVWFVTPDRLTTIMKLLWIEYLIYGLALTMTKTAVLLFFTRVFPEVITPRWWKITLWFAHALNIAWLVAYTLVEIFRCKPTSAFWAQSGTCLQQNHIYIGAAIPSVCIDLIILMLPVPMLRGLPAVVVVSIGRLITALTLQQALELDVTYEGVQSFWWGVLEAPITLLGVCLPAMVNLGQRVQNQFIFPLANRISTMIGSNSFLRWNKSKDGSSHDKHSKKKRAPVRFDSIDSLHSTVQPENPNLTFPNEVHTIQPHGGSVGRTDARDFSPAQMLRVDSGVYV
ncbi:hypothetical protein M426DRAFT_7898 [Hypoxylon sp. CI-4A]|nr:hypothetical protein M426DRAFT_7898 [Hypoxylon sp. CI-4A]